MVPNIVVVFSPVYWLWALSYPGNPSKVWFSNYWFSMIEYLCLRFSECLNPLFYNFGSPKMRRCTLRLLTSTFVPWSKNSSHFARMIRPQQHRRCETKSSSNSTSTSQIPCVNTETSSIPLWKFLTLDLTDFLSDMLKKFLCRLQIKSKSASHKAENWILPATFLHLEFTTSYDLTCKDLYALKLDVA